MQRLFASKFGQDLCEVRGRASTKNVFVNNAHKQASQMKSNGCRDVQHTGLQSTQTRRNYSSNNTGKQGAQTRDIFQCIPTSVAA